MTAAVLYGKEDVKIERVPIPRVGDGEVLVKVQVALTCGTDLKVYQRGYHARMIVPQALFGHELAGVIEEVGAGVRGFKKGISGGIPPGLIREGSSRVQVGQKQTGQTLRHP